MKKISTHKLGYVGSKPGKKDVRSASWYTPKEYLQAAKEVLGRLNLDPFSSTLANKTVKATRIFTIKNNAFDNAWKSHSGRRIKTVWMNPPYGVTMSRACHKFIEEYRKGSFDEGIVLTNNASETIWFALLLQEASSTCFTDHRILFESYDGKNVSGNTRGQTFFYFGKKTTAFAKAFHPYGHIFSKAVISKKYNARSVGSV